MSERNIYQRINAVMQEVEYVQKDAVVQGYKAVTHDQVTSAVRKSMVSNGIVIRLEQKESEIAEKRDPGNGIKMHLYSGVYDIHFVNIEDPKDFATVTIAAHAADNGDKAPGKCASYATKYAMLKMFTLETGENDESRAAETMHYNDIQKDEFDDLLAKGDARGMAVFSKTVGDEVMAALNGSFKKGEVSSNKKKLKELIYRGFDQFSEIALELSDLIAREDPSVIEYIDGLGSIEKQLISVHLKNDEIQYLRNLKNV